MFQSGCGRGAQDVRMLRIEESSDLGPALGRKE
jgi:hypothetical protein